MDPILIGNKIRELRIKVGYSQEELADGICTQAQISKIERGVGYPFANTLFYISKKLGVDPNYFFDIGTTPNLDYVKKIKKQINSLKLSFKYQEILKIINREITNPLFKENKINLQFLLWHKGIVEFEYFRDYEDAVDTYEQAFHLTPVDKIWSDQQIEIALSLGSTHNQVNEIDKAMRLYNLIREEIRKKPLVKSPRIYLRYCYTLARAYTRVTQYHESIKLCKEGIDYCISEQSLMVFGEFHYQIGYNYELMEEWPAASQYYNEARTIFRLNRNTNYDNILEDKIKLVTDKMKE
ncbi:helix-turn-helix transcriptional regulator [Sutcliffiella horikoshii]|uniref:helix-turn-helix domain-containing protein n=1 Tax=Sutcliffiella horikoshii TaxID=79883 RepID=UPI002040908D|nr:helix-turn-helix domain-containing protein [Sutcliffiella horikoshii]MCM3619808.1 helix-turn-helix transcriptional regulator [Sutcliffiella horikoshii]